jgi:hypothetical protein
VTPQQEALERARNGEPWLPFTEGQALVYGLRLREAGVYYPQIAKVMVVAHGFDRSSGWWRQNLHLRGAPPKHYADGSPRMGPMMRRRLQEASGVGQTMDTP